MAQTKLRSAQLLSYSNTTVTTSNVTAVRNTFYNLTIAGLTANRNFTLPVPSAIGDEITVTLADGDDTYFIVLIGDTGVSINNGSTATEFHRIQTQGRTITFRSTSLTNWQAVAGADMIGFSFGLYAVPPFSSSNFTGILPIPQAMRIISWQTAYYSAATTNGTHYWKIDCQIESVGVIATFNTSVQDSWTWRESTSFSTSILTPSPHKFISCYATKTNTPGVLYSYHSIKAMLC